MSVRNVTTSLTPNYSLDQILQPTTSSPGGGFRRVLGAVAGGVTNLIAPGAGGIISNIVGGAGGLSGLTGETTQFLQLQRQMQMESRAFETASAVLKSRHDASMSAIRNIR